MKTLLIQSGHPFWEKTISFARNCSWKAGRSGSGMLAYVYDRLTREQIEQFEKMPVSMKMNYPGLPAFVICHGSPWKTNESMYSTGY